MDDVNSQETVPLVAANSTVPLSIFRVHLHTREARMLCKLSNLKRCLSSHPFPHGKIMEKVLVSEASC